MIEGNGQGFQVSHMFDLQRAAKTILEDVQKEVNVGMNFKDIEALIKKKFPTSWYREKLAPDKGKN